MKKIEIDNISYYSRLMENRYTTNLQKLDGEVRNIQSFNVAFFVDNSGSTSSTLRGSAKTILMNELELIDQFRNMWKDIKYAYDPDRCVAWNNTAKIFTSSIAPDGGTDPSCIFNSDTQNVFNKAEIIVFTTDGEISQSEVTKFAKLLENRLNKVLIICALFSTSTNPPISVFAPFFAAPNLLIVQYDGPSVYKTIYTKGSISNSHPVGQTIIPSTLNISNNYPPIPAGCTVISETSAHIKVFDMKQFLAQKQIETDLTLEEWDVIIKLGKTTNTLPIIRQHVDGWRGNSIIDATEKMKAMVKSPYNDEKARLIKDIIDPTITDKEPLVKRLQEIIQLARIEETERIKTVNQGLHHVRKYWEEVRSLLNHYESATYSLNDMTSNRAKRAKDITDLTDDITPIVHDKVPQIFCSLHLDNGPAVLYFDKLDNCDITLSDWCLNFPLDRYPSLDHCIKSNPVCGDCAEAYMRYSNKTLYKEPIDSYIPIDVKNNKQYIRNRLCKLFCNSKSLNHIEMLLLSTIDDSVYTCKWLDNNVRTHLISELINNIYTTDTFTEDGTKMVLHDALSRLNTETIFRQPIIAAVRLLKFAITSLQPVNLHLLLRERVAYQLIETFLGFMLRGDMKDKINHMIYRTICGIPCPTNGIKLPSYETIAPLLTKYVDVLTDNLNQLNYSIEPNFIAHILCSLQQITEHKKPLATYRDLAKTQLFSSAFSSTETESIQAIKDRLTNYHKVTKYFIPPYSHYHGNQSTPSKLFFQDQPLLQDNLQINLELSLLLQKELSRKLSENFGSIYPNEKSAHVPIHRIVAQVVDQFDTLEPCDEMYRKVFERVRQTNGLHGNIYDYHNFAAAIYCVQDFCRIKREAKVHAEEYGFTFYDKLISEMRYLGLSSTDYSKIPVPISMHITYKIDIDKILKHLDETTVIKNLINIVVDPIHINSTETIDEWKKQEEQKIQQLKLFDTVDDIKQIATLHITTDRTDETRITASAIVASYPDLSIIAKCSIRCTTNIRYVPTFLAFRETPVLLKLVEQLKESNVLPDIMICNAHLSRGMTTASDFSLSCGIPCIGAIQPPQNCVQENELLKIDDKIVGMKVNEMYVGVGHGYSLETAARLLQNTTQLIREVEMLSCDSLAKWK